MRFALAGLDLTSSPQEAVYRERMIALLDSAPGCFDRNQFPAHFTGSALVVSADGARTLLNHHRFLNRWLQFGGHCDGEEDVLAVARREAEEESGIAGLILASARPFDLDIHAIPENPKRCEPAHEHYDIRWVLIAPEDAVCRVSEESHDLQWFAPSELGGLELDPGMLRLLGKWQALLERRRSHQPPG